jgi:16S rRNA (guanine(966)-N(2))-methyltransferase RsmD
MKPPSRTPGPFQAGVPTTGRKKDPSGPAGPDAAPDGRRLQGAAQEVRLISGAWKRSKLPVADRPELRPTPGRVRETLFNWLGQDLSGWRCLDAFAGSGALGFEAASRGAAEVVLLERDRTLVQSLERSRQRLQAGTLRIEATDALAWMARCAPQRFELVFVDPPFDARLFDAALAAAVRLLVPQGFVYLEADREFTAEQVARLGLRPHRHGRAGAVHFHLFQRDEGEPAPATLRPRSNSGDLL